MNELDDKAKAVLRAIERRTRPYTEADIAMACHLSKQVVRKRCQQLREAGFIEKKWVGMHGPYWESVRI